MPYMLLVLERGDDHAPPPDEGRRRYDLMMRFADDLAKRGVLLAGESLASGADGVRIETRGGRRAVIDGPFAEAKEIVGGFFLLDCTTKEEAVAIGGTCPAAEWSTIEVRSVAPCLEAPG